MHRDPPGTHMWTHTAIRLRLSFLSPLAPVFGDTLVLIGVCLYLFPNWGKGLPENEAKVPCQFWKEPPGFPGSTLEQGRGQDERLQWGEERRQR